MCKEYDLHYNNKKVGCVKLSQKGMFYSLNCRFQLSKSGKFRLIAQCGNGDRDLGLCVPFGRELGVECCLPIRKIGEGTIRFIVKEAEVPNSFVPIYADQPFAQLEELMNGRFSVINGVKGIVFSKATENITPQQCS